MPHPIEPVNAFVAMFDFLGFRELRKQLGTAGLYKLYQSSMLPNIQRAAARNSIGFRQISDNVTFVSEGDSFDDFTKIVNAAYDLLCSGFAGHGCPLRGAIGYGDIVQSKDEIWIGSALEDAYQGERSQVWSGCVLTKSCESFCVEQGYVEKYKLTTNRLVRYPNIPIERINGNGCRDGTIEGIALNWASTVSATASECAFRDSSDEHARKIKTNTMAFEQWARANSVAH